MPGRKDKFFNGRFYHTFNKTIDGRRIFEDEASCGLFANIAKYYRSAAATLGYSKFLRFNPLLQKQMGARLSAKKHMRVRVLAYAQMPTHFHFLVKQVRDDGVRTFMSNMVNCFTRFFNTKTNRQGPLFIPRFKSVMIQTHEQLMHVSRYIHLNPYSAKLVKDINRLIGYKWSSYREYFGNSGPFLCDTSFILDLFGGERDVYRKFIHDNADYQRSHESIKYTNKWR